MAIRAPGVECLFAFGARSGADPVRRMALQAKKGSRSTRGCCSPTRGACGTGAFLAVVRVLEHEGPFLLGVTLGAGGLHCFPSQVLFRRAPVRVVAVYAEDLFSGTGWWFGREKAAFTS